MLKRSIQIYKELENPSWNDSRLFGSIRVDQHLTSFVTDFQDELEIELLDAEGLVIDIESITEYEFLQIRFMPPRSRNSFFAKDFEDYLSYFNFMYLNASEFYISDLDAGFIDGTTTNELITSYLRILELYQLIKNVADHSEDEQPRKHTHIFLTSSGKDSIPMVYDQGDVKYFGQPEHYINIEDIQSELLSAPHKEAKKLLFKKSIVEFIKGTTNSNKFPSIIRSISEINQSYRNNYELFVHEFSFEDEKEKLEQQKQQYILKLNEILSGIHGKLLAVPVSLVLVAGQMKDSSVANYLLVNIVILFGALLFAVLMWMLTANQLHSLLAVKEGYESKKKRLKLELRNSLYNELKDSFNQLNKRFSYQRWMIRLIDLLVLLGFIFSLVIFEYHTGLILNFFNLTNW